MLTFHSYYHLQTPTPRNPSQPQPQARLSASGMNINAPVTSTAIHSATRPVPTSVPTSVAQNIKITPQTNIALKSSRDGSSKQSGRREKRKFTTDDLPAAVRPDFRRNGAVIINATRIAATLLKPFDNPSAEQLQQAVDAIFPGSGIRLAKGEMYYENVSSLVQLLNTKLRLLIRNTYCISDP